MNRASSISLRTTALAALLGVAAALPVAAQQDPRVHTVADVAQAIEQAKARGDFVILGRILRQEWGPVPEAARRLAQDSLVAVATRGDTSDERSYDAALAAITALASAGLRDAPGTADPGMLSVLEAIVTARPEVGVAATVGIAHQHDVAAARAALTRIAQRPDPSAETAVVMLMRHHGSEGEQVLRRLHVDGVVRHPAAKRLVDGLANERQWRPTPPVR